MNKKLKVQYSAATMNDLNTFHVGPRGHWIIRVWRGWRWRSGWQINGTTKPRMAKATAARNKKAKELSNEIEDHNKDFGFGNV